jgi:hypothetical protein
MEAGAPWAAMERGWLDSLRRREGDELPLPYVLLSDADRHDKQQRERQVLRLQRP